MTGGAPSMSLKDHDRQRPVSLHGLPLSRSSSFNGVSGPPNMTTWSTPVLGESYRSPHLHKRSPTGQQKKFGKMPKVPRPTRTIQVFGGVRKGLRECVIATERDIEELRSTEDESSSGASPMGAGRLFELEKQLKAAERYKKRLEFHLAKIEELEEYYLVQQRLREGAKTMAQAYVSYTGNTKAEPLLNVKCGYKECTQTMCAIEAQLENLLGTFHCKMKGLVGFARLMPGDVFEITIRHGHQKWKTKSRINTNTQTWDSDTALFKALIGENLTIKAVEMKGLGKHIQLGQKHCETNGLFSSHPQMLTVSVNTNGSIKLSVYITWNPLDGIDENLSTLEPPQRSGGTPRRRLQVHSVIEGAALNGYINGNDSGSEASSEVSSDHVTPAAANHRFSMPMFPSSINSANFHSHQPSPDMAARPNSIAVMDTISETLTEAIGSSKTGHKHSNSKLFDMRLLSESIDQGLGKQEGVTLEEALYSLRSMLEDYQGQYPELQKLEQQVHKLDKLLKKNAGAGSPRSSDVSISIERALGAFDFLESEDYIDGYVSGDNLSRRASLDALEAKCTLSPESTTKTADSGIESIAHRLSEDHVQDGSGPGSPEPPSCGNEQVDVALLWHVQYAEKLLEHLGSFGPLKCKEIYAVDKLQRQANIIERLRRIAQAGNGIPSLQDVMTEATRNRHLQQFWIKSVEGTVLYTNAERFLSQLERSYGDIIREKYDISAIRVFKVLIARILDMPVFDPETCRPCPNITMHQFFNYFSNEHQSDIDEYLETLAGEMWVTGRLKSGSRDIVIKTLLTFRDTIPPPDCLRVVSLLLISDNSEIRQTTVHYMKTIAKNPLARDKAIIIFVEALEDPSPEIRCAACVALKHLAATESLKQLVYLCQTETSPHVKQRAKDTLISFGEKGRKAYEETQLTSHGFQGVNVRL